MAVTGAELLIGKGRRKTDQIVRESLAAANDVYAFQVSGTELELPPPKWGMRRFAITQGGMRRSAITQFFGWGTFF